MTTRLMIDGKQVRVAETRKSGGYHSVQWTHFYVYDEHGRPIAEHSVPTSWFDNRNAGTTIETGGHNYAHVRPTYD